MTTPKKGTVVPITDTDLAAVCQFYHTHLNTKIPVAAWIKAFSHNWCENRPNHGFMLVDGKTIVGAFGAIYSDQWINGRMERFCNHTSWVVENGYQAWSMELLHALLEQESFHVTSFTPNPDVAEICCYLGFSLLDKQIEVFFNIPKIYTSNQVSEDPALMEAILEPAVFRDYINHRQLPWLGHCVLGDSGRSCLVVYKKKIWKKLPCAVLLHCSDPEVFAWHHQTLGSFLLFHHGMATMHIRTCWLPPQLKTGNLTIQESQPRLAISRGIDPSYFSFLYTEVTALDLPL